MRILVSSMPKAGTNLILRVFSLMPKYVNSKRFLRNNFKNEKGGVIPMGVNTPVYLTPATAKRVFTIKDNHFLPGHVPYHPALEPIIRDFNYRVVLLVRDPRDVVVSLIYYIMRRKQHYLNKYYHSLKDFDERLTASINGIKVGKTSMLSLAEQLESLSQWLDTDLCYLTKFEDLVGSNGGGSDEKQIVEVTNIAKFCNVELTEEQIVEIASKLYSRKTHTFRKGTIGDWKNHFTPEHLELLEGPVNNAVKKLGYEL